MRRIFFIVRNLRRSIGMKEGPHQFGIRSKERRRLKPAGCGLLESVTIPARPGLL